jgi:hypothetical protein
MNILGKRSMASMAVAMKRCGLRTVLLLPMSVGIALAQTSSPALISCTSGVARPACELVTDAFTLRQSFSLLRNVQFVVADADAFKVEKSRAGDYVFAHVINKTEPGALIPMLHSSFDRDIILEISEHSLLQCPDRVVISVGLFKQTMTEAKKTPPDIDPSLLEQFATFIHGYLEGCYGGRQVR